MYLFANRIERADTSHDVPAQMYNFKIHSYDNCVCGLLSSEVGYNVYPTSIYAKALRLGLLTFAIRGSGSRVQRPSASYPKTTCFNSLSD